MTLAVGNKIVSIHHLLSNQLTQLGIDPQQAPTAEQWAKLVSAVSETYKRSENINKGLQANADTLSTRVETQLLPGTDNRDLLGTVFETMGDGLCTLNKEGQLLLMNPVAEKMLGWNQNDMGGEYILDAIYPFGSGPLSPTQRLFLKLQREPELDFPEAIFRSSSGHILNVSFSLTSITHRGKFAGAVLVFRDISAILQTQVELSNKLEETLFLNTIIETLTSTLEINKILETLCTELCTHLNLPHAAFALVEKPTNKMKIVAEYIADDGPSALGEVITVNDTDIKEKVFNTHKTLYVSGKPTERDTDLREFNLHRGTISLMIIPVVVRGRVVGTLGLNADQPRHFDESDVDLVQKIAAVAGRALEHAILYKNLKRELLQKEKAQKDLVIARDEAQYANEFKSELLAKVSHELRTPLSSIVGFSEMLDMGVYGKLDGDQGEVMEQILRASEYLVLLVNDLLDISRLEMGKLVLAHNEFKVQNLIDRIERDMRRTALKKGLNLSVSVDPNMPRTLIGDIDRLNQVLNNLIGNAIKYTEQGKVEVNFKMENRRNWSMTIKDTGIGIPYEIQEKIFDHFHQGVLENFEHSRHGFGLGLAIVKQLTQLMKGEITVDSAPGKGSSFKVRLPFEQSPVPVAANVHASAETRAMI